MSAPGFHCVVLRATSQVPVGTTLGSRETVCTGPGGKQRSFSDTTTQPLRLVIITSLDRNKQLLKTTVLGTIPRASFLPMQKATFGIGLWRLK
jgi:hypothetical protein